MFRRLTPTLKQLEPQEVKMIVADTPWQPGTIAQHYDELDELYREVWGEHLHHGFWRRGDETAAEAVTALLEVVAARAQLPPGGAVCDVGCGYGGTARWLASHYGAQVTGLTLSPAQYHYACTQVLPIGTPTPTYLLHDWLTNPLPGASFDAVTALESTEHMPDLERCFAHMYRVLKPGGRVVICAWLAGETPRAWEVRHLLEPICREGRLAGLGTLSDYRRGLEGAGFAVTGAEDVTLNVRRTWSVIIGRVLWRLMTKRKYWGYLLEPQHRERHFTLSLGRLRLAYQTGALRYGLVSGVKPS